MNNQSASASCPEIILLSGGTGTTGKQVLKASLSQFSLNSSGVHVEANIRNARQATKIVKRAAETGALLCHTLVVPSVRQAVETTAVRLQVPCIDVLGPAISILGDHLQRMPKGRAGLLYEVNGEQIDRMDAMDFTLAHDDGQRTTTIDQADIVLVGPSRTTKSVTCCYLAFRGVRAANVPLFPGTKPPKELLRRPPRRVIGLTLCAAHLQSIPQTRLDRISGLPVPDYADRRNIQQELMEIRDLMRRRRWRVLDVSYKATEEVASQIIDMIPQRRGKTQRKSAKEKLTVM